SGRRDEGFADDAATDVCRPRVVQREQMARKITGGAREIFVGEPLKILSQQRSLFEFLRCSSDSFGDAREAFERIHGQIRHGSRVREAASGVKRLGTRYNPFRSSRV